MVQPKIHYCVAGWLIWTNLVSLLDGDALPTGPTLESPASLKAEFRTTDENTELIHWVLGLARWLMRQCRLNNTSSWLRLDKMINSNIVKIPNEDTEPNISLFCRKNNDLGVNHWVTKVTFVLHCRAITLGWWLVLFHFSIISHSLIIEYCINFKKSLYKL